MHSVNNKKWLPSTINISLEQERKSIDFNQEQLAEVVWSGKEKLERHRKLMDLFANDPILKNTHFHYEMTREEKMEASYAKMPSIYTKVPEEITYQNVFHYMMILGGVSTI
jgi:hypothetical protein